MTCLPHYTHRMISPKNNFFFNVICMFFFKSALISIFRICSKEKSSYLNIFQPHFVSYSWKVSKVESSMHSFRNNKCQFWAWAWSRSGLGLHTLSHWCLILSAFATSTCVSRRADTHDAQWSGLGVDRKFTLTEQPRSPTSTSTNESTRQSNRNRVRINVVPYKKYLQKHITN